MVGLSAVYRPSYTILFDGLFLSLFGGGLSFFLGIRVDLLLVIDSLLLSCRMFPDRVSDVGENAGSLALRHLSLIKCLLEGCLKAIKVADACFGILVTLVGQVVADSFFENGDDGLGNVTCINTLLQRCSELVLRQHTVLGPVSVLEDPSRFVTPRLFS